VDKIKVRVCVATNCTFAGSEALIDMLNEDEDLADFIEIEPVHCFEKSCNEGRESPVVEVERRRIFRATPELVIDMIEQQVTQHIAGLEQNDEVPHA